MSLSSEGSSEEEDTLKSHQTVSIDNKEEEETMYQQDYSDSDPDLEESHGTRCMTRRERIEYKKQLFESDGFDVKAIPRVFEIGQIQPCDLNAINGVDEYALECAIAAIDTFNNTRHKEARRVKIVGYTKIGDDEFEIMKALRRGGLLFLLSQNEIYKGVTNSGKKYPRTIVIMGLNNDERENVRYWNVRNSFGTTCGVEGYGRVVSSSSSMDQEEPLVTRVYQPKYFP